MSIAGPVFGARSSGGVLGWSDGAVIRDRANQQTTCRETPVSEIPAEAAAAQKMA